MTQQETKQLNGVIRKHTAICLALRVRAIKMSQPWLAVSNCCHRRRRPARPV